VTRAPISSRPWRRMRLRILIRDRYRCHWCGARANSVDHLVPRALGGSDWDPQNLVACCTPCNSKRGGDLRQSMAKPHPHPIARRRRIWRGAIEEE